MKKVIVLHETDGRPYYRALEELAQKNLIELRYLESSIIRLTLASVLKREWHKISVIQIIRNLVFRLCVPFISGRVVILAMAPYDFRIAWYKYLGKKNIVIEHTSWPYWGTDNVPRKTEPFTSFAKNQWKCFFSEYCSHTVSVLDDTKQSILSNYKIKGGVDVIPHVVGFNVTDKLRDWNRKPAKILFVGKLISEKGLELLNTLGIWAKKEGLEFGIVGDGKDRSAINGCLKAGVVHYGLIDDRKAVAEIYANYDILLVPSKRREGWEELFGIVIIEAMASGLVVLASDHIGPRNIIETDCNGYTLDETDLDQWKSKILTLSDDCSLRQQIAQKAIIDSKQYHLSEVSKRWEEVLNKF